MTSRSHPGARIAFKAPSKQPAELLLLPGTASCSSVC